MLICRNADGYMARVLRGLKILSTPGFEEYCPLPSPRPQTSPTRPALFPSQTAPITENH